MKSLTLKTTQTIELTRLAQWFLLLILLLLCLFAIKLTWWFAVLLLPITAQMLINNSRINQQPDQQLILNSEQSFLLLNDGVAQAQKLQNHWKMPQFLMLTLSDKQQKHQLLIKKSTLTPEQFTLLTLALIKSSE